MVRTTVLLLLALVSGCSTFGRSAGDAIVGRWSSEVGGYPVVVSYDGSMVTVDGASPVAYMLDGNELSFDGGGSQVRIVRFPSRSEMIQSDPMTGAEYLYTRID